MERERRSGVDRFRDHALALWLAVLLFFVVGDLVTTSVGLSSPHVREAGPLVGVAIERYGFEAVVLLKLVTLLAGVAAWRIAPSPYDMGVPFGLATLGVAVTGWNVIVLSPAW